jgi:hypothetical protein
MSRTFTKMSADAFVGMQMDVGVVLNTFNPTKPGIADGAILYATSGGNTVSCKPTISDMGSDVDNCPENTKELAHIDGYECKMSHTALEMTAEAVRRVVGAADITNSDGVSKIVPRMELKDTDFADLWWVGDLVGGGMAAVRIKNALSTGGLSLKTTKNGKGQITVEYTGFMTISDVDDVPMEFYVSTDEVEAA